MSRAGKILHVLGGGEWQVPTVRLAKEMGWRVLVTDMYASRPAYEHADYHEIADITDGDKTLEIARRHKIDGIVCDTTDVGVPTMAWVAEKMGLPGIGYQTALNFTNKYSMRQVTAQAGIPTPTFRLLRSASDLPSAVATIGWPIVLKPVDGQSSRGVHVVRLREELEKSFEDALSFSRSREVIAEGFLDGQEITVEGYCQDGTPQVAAVSDKGHLPERREVANRITYPAALSANTLDRVHKVNSQTVKALGLRNGITHAEYFVCGEDVYLVEIAARGGGSRIYSHIVPQMLDTSLPAAYLRFLMGEDSRLNVPASVCSRAANLQFFSFPSGRVRRIMGVEEARGLAGVQEILLEFAVGDELRPPQDDRSRPGQVLVFGATREEVLETTRQVLELVKVEVE
jgi:carbamoyl-phosphate synthase large subunit